MNALESNDTQSLKTDSHAQGFLSILLKVAQLKICQGQKEKTING